MSQGQPAPSADCRYCRARNVPGAPHCWLCDAPDWHPALGPAAVATHAAPRHDAGDLVFRVILGVLAVATVLVLVGVVLEAPGLGFLSGGVWAIALGSLLIGHGSRQRGWAAVFGVIAMLAGVAVLLAGAVLAFFAIACFFSGPVNFH